VVAGLRLGAQVLHHPLRLHHERDERSGSVDGRLWQVGGLVLAAVAAVAAAQVERAVAAKLHLVANECLALARNSSR
jgi:hypothetical protein